MDARANQALVAEWLRSFAKNHRFFATTDDAAMTQRDHAWFAEKCDELAELLELTSAAGLKQP